MGSFSIWHWLIVLLIVVMVFGTKKLLTRTPLTSKHVTSLDRGFGCSWCVLR
jgi:hypothetical protein